MAKCWHTDKPCPHRIDYYELRKTKKGHCRRTLRKKNRNRGLCIYDYVEILEAGMVDGKPENFDVYRKSKNLAIKIMSDRRKRFDKKLQ